MTDTEKHLRERQARLKTILDQLDAETQRMREFERQALRQQKMQCYGTRY